jgi:hypothetical protein
LQQLNPIKCLDIIKKFLLIFSTDATCKKGNKGKKKQKKQQKKKNKKKKGKKSNFKKKKKD